MRNRPIDLDEFAPSQPIDVDDITIAPVPSNRRLQTVRVIGGSLAVTLAALVSLSILAGVELRYTSAIEETTSQEDASHKSDNGMKMHRKGPLLQSLPPTALPSLRPSYSPSASVRPSALPSITPTTSSSPSVSPTYHPSQSIAPSQSLLPTVSNAPSSSLHPSISTSPSASPSHAPTLHPTIQPTSTPTIQPTSTPTIQPTSTPTTEPTYSTPSNFRLRLHWKSGYYWQESFEEAWWCLSCAECDDNLFNEACALRDKCEEGMTLGIVECKPGKSAGVRFTLENNLFRKKQQGDVIRLYDRDLCMARKRNEVFLEKCTGDKDQRWMGFRPEKEFELYPYGKEGERCLTQHHHPKKGERVFAEKCDTARKTTTSSWTVY